MSCASRRCRTPADTLRRCDAIRGRHGRYGIDGLGLEAMAAGLEVCKEIIRSNSPNQMFDAFAESVSRIIASSRSMG
jgi:hypothetical protein